MGAEALRLARDTVQGEWQDLGAGRIQSVQRLVLPVRGGSLEDWASPAALQSLLRRYFVIAEQNSLHLVRVRWDSGGPVIRLRWLRVPLIAMGRPTVELGTNRRAIGVPVCGGLLAVGDPGARLWLALTREPHVYTASVELVGYRPRGNALGLLRWLYHSLQARLHARVGHRFLSYLRCRWTADDAPAG